MNTDRTQKILEAIRIILQAEKEGTMTPDEALENVLDIISVNTTPEPEPDPEPPMVAIPNDDIEIVKLQLQAIALRQMFNTGWRH